MGAAERRSAAQPDDAHRDHQPDVQQHRPVAAGRAQGNPTAPIFNKLVNYGWEYAFHCHILSHEEMDMMRPVSVAMPPVKADTLAFTVTGTGNNRRFVISFKDNSIAETGYVLQRTSNGTTWDDVGTSASPLDQPNTAGGTRSITDTTSNVNAIYRYRVVAQNTVGYLDGTDPAVPGSRR